MSRRSPGTSRPHCRLGRPPRRHERGSSGRFLRPLANGESISETVRPRAIASTSGSGSRRNSSISSAQDRICGTSPTAASMKCDDAVSDMQPSSVCFVYCRNSRKGPYLVSSTWARAVQLAPRNDATRLSQARERCMLTSGFVEVFGRRLPRRVEAPVIPASENLDTRRHHPHMATSSAKPIRAGPTSGCDPSWQPTATPNTRVFGIKSQINGA